MPYLTKDEFDVWSSDPTTKKIMNYFKDWRNQVGEDIALEICSGKVPDERYLDKSANACLILGMIASMSAKGINSFYGEEEDTKD